jgi:hypothetical protein
MKTTYSNLSLATLDKKGHDKTCGYWYLVTEGARSYTAFPTRTGLMNWLQERGLLLTEELPEHGEASYQRIAGSHTTMMHGDIQEFYDLDGEPTRIVSNGDYTLAIITDDSGHKTVHYLNPNCERPKYDYASCRNIYASA